MMKLALSVVLPAYNESLRLPPFLTTLHAYLPREFGDAYEVIVVDDGSTDDLVSVVEEAFGDWPQLSMVCHPANQGKGAAVRTGMLRARGRWLLFADADGATPIEEERRLRAALEAGADIAVGSRLLRSREVTRRRSPVRALVGRGFAWLARRMLHLPVRDTQCGFKMFSRNAGRHLFSLAEETGYLFDLEVLALAQRLGYRVVEVPVNWSEIPGGHLSLARQWRTIWSGLRRLRWKMASAEAPESQRQDRSENQEKHQ